MVCRDGEVKLESQDPRVDKVVQDQLVVMAEMVRMDPQDLQAHQAHQEMS